MSGTNISFLHIYLQVWYQKPKTIIAFLYITLAVGELELKLIISHSTIGRYADHKLLLIDVWFTYKKSKHVIAYI